MYKIISVLVSSVLMALPFPWTIDTSIIPQDKILITIHQTSDDRRDLGLTFDRRS
jgi:hypothetical protein